MAPAILLATIALVLIRAGWKNQPIVDAALGKDPAPRPPKFTEDPGGGDLSVPTGASGETKIIDGKPVAPWIVPFVLFARSHGWPGVVTSGYRDPRVKVTPSPGLPVAPQGKSNHNGTIFPKGAIDVSHPDEFERALRKFMGPVPLRRDPSIHDPVHFSVTGR